MKIQEIKEQESGNALIEFALIIPVFIVLLLGVLNYGLALQKYGTIADSARAGAESALLQSCAANQGCYADTAKMQSVAASSAASAGISDYKALATNFCTCSPGSGVTVGCTSSCSGYGQPAMYVQVTATGTIPLLFGGSPGIAVKSVARVRIACQSC